MLLACLHREPSERKWLQARLDTASLPLLPGTPRVVAPVKVASMNQIYMFENHKLWIGILDPYNCKLFVLRTVT